MNEDERDACDDCPYRDDNGVCRSPIGCLNENEDDKCETCKKLGNVNCGNDTLGYRCYERKPKC